MVQKPLRTRGHSARRSLRLVWKSIVDALDSTTHFHSCKYSLHLIAAPTSWILDYDTRKAREVLEVSYHQTTLVCKRRGLREVDLKSTVIDNRLPVVFFDILLDHFVGDISRVDG
jgi:hypothetical protein